MGKALAGRIAILGRREHGAAVQHKTVGILVVLANGLRDQLGRFSADLAHIALAAQHKALFALNTQANLRTLDILYAIVTVEQADHGADRG